MRGRYGAGEFTKHRQPMSPSRPHNNVQEASASRDGDSGTACSGELTATAREAMRAVVRAIARTAAKRDWAIATEKLDRRDQADDTQIDTATG